MKPLSILILAAGEGTRMKSDLPKVLHQAAGKPLVEHVIAAALPLKGEFGVVLGKGVDLVKERLSHYPGLKFFLQKERLGSGHAVKTAAAWMKKRGGDVVVLCGDAPMIKRETLRELVAIHRREKNAATMLTARVENPFGYGRIIRDGAGRPQAIIEQREAASDQLAVNEINSGTYCFSVSDLLQGLARLRADNSKGEYYITDVISFLVNRGRPVGALCVQGGEEALGVNRRRELAEADRILRRRVLDRLMDDGVTVIDPSSTYVDEGVEIGPDTILYPQTFLHGKTRIGRGCRIGPFTLLRDCAVKNDVEIRASFAYNAEVADGVHLGPYAHLRPGSKIGPGAKVGNFVEIKNSTVGPQSKVGHLAYVGDATLGTDVNIGAGVITCNYDGYQKFHTTIGSGAFIGSNANLVAPVTVGRGALVGAGSTVTKDVPADSLALERAPQILKKGWARRRRLASRTKKHA